MIKVPGKAEAERFFNYPYEAIEEALSNALYHKGYDERKPNEVRIEKDMIEIISHPGPDRSVTIEGLKSYKVRSRRYRNRRIGEFLKELHLTEGRNTGFKKIIDALKKNGSLLPEFETDESHDYFITRLFIHEGFEHGDIQHENDTDNVTKNGTDSSESVFLAPVKEFLKTYSEKKRETALAILNLISENNSVTADQITEATCVSRRTVLRYLKEIQEAKILKREGSNTSGKWILVNG